MAEANPQDRMTVGKYVNILIKCETSPQLDLYYWRNYMERYGIVNNFQISGDDPNNFYIKRCTQERNQDGCESFVSKITCGNNDNGIYYYSGEATVICAIYGYNSAYAYANSKNIEISDYD